MKNVVLDTFEKPLREKAISKCKIRCDLLSGILNSVGLAGFGSQDFVDWPWRLYFFRCFGKDQGFYGGKVPRKDRYNTRWVCMIKKKPIHTNVATTLQKTYAQVPEETKVCTGKLRYTHPILFTLQEHHLLNKRFRNARQMMQSTAIVKIHLRQGLSRVCRDRKTIKQSTVVLEKYLQCLFFSGSKNRPSNKGL